MNIAENLQTLCRLNYTKKYDLKSRKRSRTQDHVEDQSKQTVQQPTPKQDEKDKQPEKTVPVYHGESSRNQQDGGILQK